MGLFNWFAKGKATDSVAIGSKPVVHEAVADLAFDRARARGEIRRGMWVRWGEQVGIVTDVRFRYMLVNGQELKVPDVYDVMLVDDAGFNRLQVQRPGADLRQAEYADIPEPRRPDRAAAAKLGY